MKEVTQRGVWIRKDKDTVVPGIATVTIEGGKRTQTTKEIDEPTAPKRAAKPKPTPEPGG